MKTIFYIGCLNIFCLKIVKSLDAQSTKKGNVSIFNVENFDKNESKTKFFLLMYNLQLEISGFTSQN